MSPPDPSMVDSLKGELNRFFSSDNVVFSGGFGLAILAASAQLARSSYKTGLQLLRRHFLVTLEVTSKDRSYPWVLQWLALKGTRTQHLSVETMLRSTQGNKAAISFDLVPGPGQHLLQYAGRIFLVQRMREQQMLDLNSGKPWEKILFTTIGKKTSVFDSLLNDAYSLSVSNEEGKTLIFTNWGSEWRQFGQPRRKRPIESVILDERIADNLMKDVNEWISSSKWYIDRGIPYRRGYLLHGPPGSGKSSFIFSLAGKLNYNICILNLSEKGLTDERLGLALSSVPPQVSRTAWPIFDLSFLFFPPLDLRVLCC
jgi:chaperone BCS1